MAEGAIAISVVRKSEPRRLSQFDSAACNTDVEIPRLCRGAICVDGTFRHGDRGA